MENPKYTPPIEQGQAQNTPIEGALPDASYDELWNQDRVQQHMDNVQMLHGVWWRGVYWHHGMPQRGR